ncbi:MAG: AAA family ATPase [Bacilli bacterium]|nr:AAA family ATPase [Bacilli bacterium]
MKSIEEIRLALGYSQEKISGILGISKRTYYNLAHRDDFTGSDEYASLLSKLRHSLPPLNVVGDDFRNTRERGFYYVDKTKLIEDLIEKGEDLILFTRPRRFGKSLNLSMIRYFFDKSMDSSSLFSGLYISKNATIFKAHLNRYPTIFLTLKDLTFARLEDNLPRLGKMVAAAFEPYRHLARDERLNAADKDFLCRLEQNRLSAAELSSSLLDLSRILESCLGEKSVIIVDEYDVPLEKASLAQGDAAYNAMVEFIRTFFSSAFKSNPHLFKGVLSGCLRISKESIFTGLNNVVVRGVLDKDYAEYFGFTDEEVHTLLQTYLLLDKEEEVREFYDGYCFSSCRLYCPYDVLNYVKDHLSFENATPRYYWANSSGNEILERLLEKADSQTMDEIEGLMEGNSIIKSVRLDLSFKDLYDSMINIYSVMLASGYLTCVQEVSIGEFELKIPNKQIHYLFKTQIKSHLENFVIPGLVGPSFLQAFFQKDINGIARPVNAFLLNAIGIQDYARNKEMAEAFYHGVLLTMLSTANKSRFIRVFSNREKGEGYPDLIIENPLADQAVIIEIKQTTSPSLDEAFQEGKNQILDKRYQEGLRAEYGNVIAYVAVFQKKRFSIKLIEDIQ